MFGEYSENKGVDNDDMIHIQIKNTSDNYFRRSILNSTMNVKLIVYVELSKI